MRLPSHALALMAVITLSGCANVGLPVTQADIDDRSKIIAARDAVKVGKYSLAESILSDFVYRSDNGDLKVEFWGLKGSNRDMVIDTVEALLWESGKDTTNIQFANTYLTGKDRQTVLCRIAERQADYPKAYECWNKMGDIDRARRSMQMDAAIRVFSKP